MHSRTDAEEQSDTDKKTVKHYWTVATEKANMSLNRI